MPMVLWTSFLAFVCTYVSDLQFLVYVQCGPHLLAHNYVGFATLVYTWPGLHHLLSRLFMFLVNTSWSMPTTDADGALDFVSGLHLHLHFRSAISGICMCTAVNTYFARLCGLSSSFVS